MASDKKVNL